MQDILKNEFIEVLVGEAVQVGYMGDFSTPSVVGSTIVLCRSKDCALRASMLEESEEEAR